MKNNFIKGFFLHTIILLILSAGLFLLTFYVILNKYIPFSDVKVFIDSLTADGEVLFFTQSFYNASILRLRAVGILFFMIGIVFYIVRNNLYAFISKIYIKAGKDLPFLSKAYFELFKNKQALYFLIFIIMLGFIIRLKYLFQEMRYDEAFTFITYASHNWPVMLFNYSHPNNHIFHSFLVYVCHFIFGSSPWAVRLPAFMAGVLLIPATYAAAKYFYNELIAVLSAVFVFSSALLVEYSVNARGYTILCLIVMCTLFLAAFVKNNRNMAAWLILIILSALGFFTIPTMLYPYGIIMLWLLISFLLNDVNPVYNAGTNFIKYFFSSIIAVILLSLFFYLSIFMAAGVNSVIGNRAVAPLSWNIFFTNMGMVARSIWQEWNLGFPKILMPILLSGCIISVFYNRRISKNHRLHLFIPAFLWISIALVIQRVAPPSRTWLFLLPVFFIWACAGIYFILHRYFIFFKATGKIFLYAAIAFVTLFFGFRSFNSNKYYIQNKNAFKDGDELAEFLKGYIDKNDILLSICPVDAPLLYYMKINGLSYEHYINKERIRNRDYDRALLVLGKAKHHTFKALLDDVGIVDELNIEGIEKVEEYETLTLYKAFKK